MGGQLFSPSHIVAIDLADSRLEAAKQFGADVVVNNGSPDPIAVLKDLTGGLGADVAIEAVGVPATFELAAALVRPGGHVANIGVHGKPVSLRLEDLWTRDVTITTGFVDTSSTPALLKRLRGNQLDATKFVTHLSSRSTNSTPRTTRLRAPRRPDPSKSSSRMEREPVEYQRCC